MAQTCLTVDMSPPRICERGPSPSGLDNIFGSLRMGALVRASVPLPSRACRGAQGGGLRGVGSRVYAVPSMKALPASGPYPQDRRGLSTGIPRPRKNPRSEMQGVIPGDPKAWVLPLKPPSSPGSGGTAQKLTQEGGAPAHTGAWGPQAQALLPGGAHCGQDGSAAIKEPSAHGPC